MNNCEGVGWIQLAEVGVKMRAPVNPAISLDGERFLV
jgi:hypothetical protein